MTDLAAELTFYNLRIFFFSYNEPLALFSDGNKILMEKVNNSENL